MHALGAGPAPIPFKSLTPELLAQAVQEAMTDENMRKRAYEVGKLLEKEDGIKETMDLFLNAASRPAV